jgi:hypothetical protein
MSENKPESGQASKPPSCDFRTNFRSFAYYSGQFAVDIFWGMIMSLVTPFMTDRLGASDELTSLIWMTAPFAGLVTGTYVGSLVDSLGNTDSEKRTYRLGVMWISLGFIIVLCAIFPFIPIWWPPETEEKSRLACALATILFFLLMIAINFYMTPYFCMKDHFGKAPVSKFVPPIWSALGNIAALMIIKYPPRFVPDNYRTHYFFGCAVALMALYTFILQEAVMQHNFDPKKDDIEETIEIADIDKIDCSSCPSLRDVCCKPWEALADYFREGGFVIALIVIFSWASLYSILPVANDWYARVICGKLPGEPGYRRAVAEASNLRLCQQLAQLAASLFFAAITLHVEPPEKDGSNDTGTDSTYEYHRFRDKYCNLSFQVMIQFLCLTGLSLGLFLISIAQTNPVLYTYIGFALTGLGPVVIYPGREFQRAFFRQVRSIKNPGDTVAYYPNYSTRNSTYDGVVYNNFIVLGQILTFLLYQALLEKVGYPNLIMTIGLGSGGLSALLVLLTLFSYWKCPCMKSCLKEGQSCKGYCCTDKCSSIYLADSSGPLIKSPEPNFSSPNSVVKAAPRILLRTPRKKHQL